MLPDEVEEMMRLEKEERMAKVEAFGATLAKKRDDAVEGRQSSGIEEEWWEAEEQYQGVDDANRGESSNFNKPTQTGGSFIGKAERKDTRSTVFLNITRPYVDAAAAKVADMLLPTDDRNWGIKPTPVPELARALKDERPVTDPMGQPMMGQAPAAQQPPGMPPAQPQPPKPLTVADMAKREMDAAKEKAEGAEKQIEDWLIECQYHAEVRKVIEDCAKLGTGILKGPFPEKKRKRSTEMGQGGMALTMEIAYDPASKRINPWNLYPDPACGESIHNGSYIFEKDEITARQVKDLIGVPGYLDDQINKVLEEGPGKKYENAHKMNQRSSLSEKEKYEIWYYNGVVDAEDLEVVGIDPQGLEGGIHAIVTMINDTVIKAAMQPLDNGEFPYDLMPWQRKTDMPYGTGVSKQVRTPQRIVNAGTRNMMDNAGVSAGGQFVIRRGAVEPADGSWTISPRKIWFVKDDADIRSVADAFAMINLPNAQAELMAIIQFAMKMAEDVTGLPMLLQGQQGKAPDTVGGMQLLANNASSVLRRIARTFDDCITEPHIRRYYTWLMEYGEDDEVKGDFSIDARGSTALVERDIAQQAILGLGNFVNDPSYEISKKKWIQEVMKSQRIDPKRLEMDEEEKQALAQQQPQPLPQVQAAQIRAEVDTKKLEVMQGIAQLENQTMQTRIKVDTDRDHALVNAQHESNMAEAQARMAELQVKREIEILKYSTQQKISLEQAKVQLATDAAKINLQRELAGAANAIDVHKHRNPSPQVTKPPVEPAGRAPNGQAYQR